FVYRTQHERIGSAGLPALGEASRGGKRQSLVLRPKIAAVPGDSVEVGQRPGGSVRGGRIRVGIHRVASDRVAKLIDVPADTEESAFLVDKIGVEADIGAYLFLKSGGSLNRARITIVAFDRRDTLRGNGHFAGVVIGAGHSAGPIGQESGPV